jgi:DNA-directed RNA polymerase I subunit RPA2
MAPRGTDTTWDHEYNLARRQDLFRNPPTDHSAYPALQAAVDPHIQAFNALFPDGGRRGLIDHGLAEIGTKTYLDSEKNRLTLRCKSVTLQKSQVPPGNKFAKNREIFPAECRERHATYRGKLVATFEYRINGGDWEEFVRDLGQLPIMVKVGL